MWTESDKRKIDRAIGKAAKRIRDALTTLVSELPESAAPQMAIGLIARELIESEPQLFGWMLDQDELANLPLQRLLEERQTWSTRIKRRVK